MRYRRKPTEIEAWRFMGIDSISTAPEWLREALRDGRAWWQGGPTPFFTLKTNHGEAKAYGGDWIIKGPGMFHATYGERPELYPCAHDTFCSTYEEA